VCKKAAPPNPTHAVKKPINNEPPKPKIPGIHPDNFGKHFNLKQKLSNVIGDPRLYDENEIFLSRNQHDYVMSNTNDHEIAFYPGDYVTLQGLQSKPEWNDEEAMVMKPVWSDENDVNRVLRFEIKLIGAKYGKMEPPHFGRLKEKNIKLKWSPMREYMDKQRVLNTNSVFDANDADPRITYQPGNKDIDNGTTAIVTYSVKMNNTMSKLDKKFHSACQNGNVQQVKSSIKAGAKINGVDKRFGALPTGLWMACQAGHEKVVAILLSRGARFDIETKSSRHPSVFCSPKNYFRCFASLCKDPKCKQGYGCAPLLIAAEKDHFGIVLKLLSVGADPNSRDSMGLTALLCSCRTFDNSNCAKALIENGADIHWLGAGPSCLSYAAEGGNLDLVNLLLELGCSQTVGVSPPIMCAFTGQHWNVADALLKYPDADVNCFLEIYPPGFSDPVQSTSLMQAIASTNSTYDTSQLKKIKTLVNRFNCDVTWSGNLGICALTQALNHDVPSKFKHKVIKFLLSQGADPDERSRAGPNHEWTTTNDCPEWTHAQRARWWYIVRPETIELRTVELLEKTMGQTVHIRKTTGKDQTKGSHAITFTNK
jgi:ankyrin repeat protein